jgi:hypothetical protein
MALLVDDIFGAILSQKQIHFVVQCISESIQLVPILMNFEVVSHHFVFFEQMMAAKRFGKPMVRERPVSLCNVRKIQILNGPS